MSLLIVTDQPFWRRSNGAHQRTWSLYQFFCSRDVPVVVFYMIGRTESDVTTCEQLSIEVIEFDPDRSRRSVLSFAAIKNAADLFRNVWGRDPHQRGSATRSLTLDDYRWPGAAEQFSELVHSMTPSVVMFDYVIWADVLRNHPRKKRNFQAIVNTHDLLHKRNRQFSDRQQDHWIDISKDEEAAALRQFDLILAIQSEESAIMKTMAPSTPVIVAGHCCLFSENSSVPEIDPRPATAKGVSQCNIGFIGSRNAANADGIIWFLNSCWPRIHEMTGARLIIAGTVCDEPKLADFQDNESIDLLGRVEHLESFYSQVDFTINPVRFGSGLKIKMIESLHFGKPMVVHSHCTKGVTQSILDGVCVAEDADDFCKACVKLVNDSMYRENQTSLAKKIAAAELSLESVYAELSKWLEQ